MRRGSTAGSKKQATAPKSEPNAPSFCVAVVFVPVAGCGRGKPCHTPPAASPPGSRGPRLGRAVGGLRASAGRLPSWSRRGVRRAAGARRARPRAVAVRSCRAKYSRSSGWASSESSVPAASRFTVSSFASSSRVKATFRCASLMPTKRLGQPGMAGAFRSAVEAVGGWRAGRTGPSSRSTAQRAPAFLFSCASCRRLEPLHIRIHDAEGVAALLLGVGFLELHEVAFADVAGVGVAQVAAEQVQA